MTVLYLFSMLLRSPRSAKAVVSGDPAEQMLAAGESQQALRPGAELVGVGVADGAPTPGRAAA
jgi:hypothetical protein